MTIHWPSFLAGWVMAWATPGGVVWAGFALYRATVKRAYRRRAKHRPF